MARSIGDRAVKGVGVIAEPEVLMHDFTVRHQGPLRGYAMSRRSLLWDDKCLGCCSVMR